VTSPDDVVGREPPPPCADGGINCPTPASASVSLQSSMRESLRD
jgi:hypothetical protein